MLNNIILNKEQKEAVEYNKGPLFIIAGAGTGKTTVIVEKIKYIIKNKLAKPEEILALTFTDKASFEMEERVDKNMPYGCFQMWISTFHSFADQILQEEASQIGLPLGYKILTTAESIIFLRNNLFVFDLKYFRPLGNPNKFIKALLQHFSRLKDEDITPQQYLKWAKQQQENPKLTSEEKLKIRELAESYKTFQVLKIKQGYLDFADLIYYLLLLFRKRKNVLKKYKKQFRYFLVDEFQDTNIAQYELIKLLAPPNKNHFLTVVGDDSQAIFKFRGASISNILSFIQDYPEAKQVSLLKNYRSTQPILDSAYKLIKHNDPDTLESRLGISKQLIAHNPKKDSNRVPLKEDIQLHLTNQVEEETDFVSKEILKLKKKFKYSDFAILVRANNHSKPFIRSLARHGIPFQFLGAGMLYKQPEVKDLIAYLKILYNLEDSVSIYRVLSMDLFNLDKKDISVLLSFSRKTNLSLFQAIEVYLGFIKPKVYQKSFEIYKKYLPILKEKSIETTFTIYKMIKKHLKLINKKTAGEILYYFLEDSKYLNKLVSYKTKKEEKIALNISKFFNKLKIYETNHEDASIFAVVDYLEMSLELGESPIVADIDKDYYDAVNILTVHSAKGLEFPIIFLVNLTKGRFPTYKRREPIPIPEELIKEILPEGDYHLEEERRLFYVALTRAMKKIYLTASHYYGEKKRRTRISPFIVESLGTNWLEKYQKIEKDKKKQLTIFDFKKPVEQIIKIQPINQYLSFSQINTYRTCPLQYKYNYVLKIPTTPNAAASFGSTIHKTLYEFYKQFLTNNNIDLSQLLKIYHQVWIPIGYSSLTHQKRMENEGKQLLINYFKKHHSKNIKILGLEKLFKIKVKTFSLEKEKKTDNNVTLTGKIDRIDIINNNSIEIIDYKTGKKPAEKKLKKDIQLSIYALATINNNLFGKKLHQLKLSYFYLQTQEKITLTKNQEDLKQTKQMILDIVDKIQTSSFKPNVGPWCDFCPFRIICEAWQ